MYRSMGEEEIIYDPMETMPLTSAQDPSLDPMQSGKTQTYSLHDCARMSCIC